MSFTEREKTIALAIVKIFETSKPFGDYSAVAVLDDGAGISYGTSQFTHKSGSLAAVLRRYEKLGGPVQDIIGEWYDEIITKTEITDASRNSGLKKELKALGKDPLMQRAQREIAFENYLKPALDACEGSDFNYPLSLAVIYDSINQGGYARVRDRVQFQPPGNGSIKPEEFEKEWITEYCRRRITYLKGLKSSAAKASVYRPNFFLVQIDRGNWNLNLPMTVHGHKLTEAILFPNSAAAPAPENLPNTKNENLDTAGIPAEIDSQPTDPPPSLVPVVTPVVEVETITAAPTTEAPKATGDEPDMLTRINTRAVALQGGIGTVVTGVLAWVASNSAPIALGFFGAVALITIAVVITTSISNGRKDRRQKEFDAKKLAFEVQERQAREARAHEVQMAMIESARNKHMNTVRMIPPPPATEMPNTETEVAT